jgi:hypothetical protein
MSYILYPVASGVLVWLVYLLGIGIYRLYFHPLAKFPGPKYAVLSRWHECYYDVYLQGKFIFWIEEQHKNYGLSPSINVKTPSTALIIIDQI